MLVDQVFEAWLFPDPLTALNSAYDEGENITEGILNVDITSGTDIYEGPQQQIDTGQFTIVTRNPNLDPKINPNIKYDSTIKFVDTRTGEFFRGYVTDIQVEYQREDNPIITITGTDIFGAMQRVVIDQDTHDAIVALSTGPTWSGITFTEFMPYMIDFTSKYLDLDAFAPPGYPQPYGFWFPATNSFGEINVDAMAYSPAKYIPQVGETFLDVITKYAQTNLTYFNSKSDFGFDYIEVNSFVKYNPNYWTPQSDPLTTYTTYDFSSSPADDRPYQSILIDNGYNRVINQIDISNESRYIDAGEVKSDTLNFTRTSAESIENYAISASSVSTIFPSDNALPETDWADSYAQNIFQVVQFPSQEIKQITFDNARAQMIEDDFSYSDYQLHKIIRIKHQINNIQTIDRIYDIAGINHNISPDDWSMTFTLKPSKQEIAFQYQGSLPTLNMNALSGDSNFNFTATIENIDPGNVNQVVWALSATDSNEVAAIWPYAVGGYMFKNGLPRTGLTQTWNFDDDGILEAYSFDGDSTPTNILDNRYGGYGVGYWHVYAFIQLTNGFWIVLQQELTVGTPAVEADFGWVQNLTNNFGQVQFTDTSVNHETGEPDSYLWDFGDGTTSTQRNPLKTYDPAPSTTTYTVSLTVFAYGVGGAKVYNTRTKTVTLVQPTMTANFTFIQNANTSTVNFTNTSTNVGFEEPDAYLWNFGDGTTSTQKHPIHVFPASENVPVTYSVSLTTRNIWEQTASVTKSVTVLSLNDAGTLSVNNIRLTVDNYDTFTFGGDSLEYPYMIFLKAKTSYTQANLIYQSPTSRSGTTSNVVWYEADGTTAEAGDPLNLTRDPSITPLSQYGLSPAVNNTTPQSTKWILTTAAPNTQNIKTIEMTLRDTDCFAGTTKPIVLVDVPDSFGGWLNIGYFNVPPGKINPNVPYGVCSEGLKTMVARRPMPPNIPYFKYTFDNLTASFTSMETGVSYAWNFGDGTTSTLKNPVKTFPRRGTYTVSLTVTFSGGGTRTTTEPVIVEAIAPFDVRYVKFEQNEHDGINALDTPWISDFTMKNIQNPLNSYIVRTPGSGEQLIVGTTVAKQDFYPMEYVSVDGTGAFNPTVNPGWFRLMNSSNGFRAKSLDAGFLTKWNLICDFKQAYKNVADFTLNAGKGNSTTVAAGISYSVYVTNHTGPTIDPNAVTWLKVGDIIPTAMTELRQTYSIVPS